MTQTTLETGTYEIIRNRLLNQGSELRNRPVGQTALPLPHLHDDII